MSGRGTTRPALTFAFCDLVASTELLTRLGDAWGDELRRDVFACLRRGLHNTGGMEVKNQGDGLMATFGRPTDAARCAAAWHRSIARLAARPPGISLALRVGLAAGVAVYDEAEADWFGTPVVAAARLCAAAPSGSTLATAAVAVGPGWEDNGSLVLKGFPEPVPTLRAMAEVPASPVPTPLRAPLPPGLDLDGLPPLVGREQLLAEVVGMLSTPSPHGGAISIAGEPGAGASRLAAEAVVRAGDPRAERFVLHAPVRAGDAPLLSLLDAARWWVAGATDEDLASLTEVLTPLAPWVPLIGVRLRAMGSLAADLPGVDRSVQGEAVEDATRPLDGFLSALARRQRSTLLVVDDADLLDEPTVDLLIDLLGSALPLTLLLAHRAPDPGDPLGRLLGKLAGRTTLHEVHVGPLGPGEVATLVAGVAGADLIDGRPASVRDVVHRATAGRPSVAVQLGRHLGAGAGLTAACARAQPYRGLLPFGAEQAELFFGRSELVARCLAHLDETDCLMLVGNSGSGKSSLLHAGVMPALAASRASPTVVPMRVEPAMVAGMAAGGHGRRCFVIDQLEELFTVLDDQRTRDEIGGELAGRRAAGDQVIVTLRGDFYGHLATVPTLQQLAELGSILVGPPTGDELREVITAPAAVAGLMLEPGLVELIVADVEDQPGGLPLLSHALYETWNRQRGGVLSVDSYLRAGGVSGAIARTAERVYVHELDKQAQTLARRLFLRLVRTNDDGPDTRRRLPEPVLSELRTAPGASAVVDRLLEARLVTIDEGGMELAHEALLRAWPRLQEWIHDDRDGLRIQRRIADHTEMWEAGGRQPSDLLRGARLEQALDWASGRPTEVTTSERAFLEAGRAQRAAEAADAERQLQLQRRANRRLRRLLVALVAVLVGAASLALVARAQRDRASELARSADARALARQVPAITDPVLARLLAREAAELDATVATDAALLRSLLLDDRELWSKPVPDDALVGADGEHVTTVLGSQVTMTDLAAGELTSYTLEGRSESDRPAALSHDGRHLARRVGSPSAVRLDELATSGASARGRYDAGAPVESLSFSADGDVLGVGTSDALALLSVPSLEPVSAPLPLGTQVGPEPVWDVDLAAGRVALAVSYSESRVGTDVADVGVTSIHESSTILLLVLRTGTAVMRHDVPGQATSIALGSDALAIGTESAGAAGLARRTSLVAVPDGAPLASTIPDVEPLPLGDGRIGLSGRRSFDLWDPSAPVQADAPVVPSTEVDDAWVEGDLLFTVGSSEITAWRLGGRLPLRSAMVGPPDVDQIAVDPSGGWAALVVKNIDLSGGTQSAIQNVSAVEVIALRGGGGPHPGLEPIARLEGETATFSAGHVFVDGIFQDQVRYSLPNVQPVAGESAGITDAVREVAAASPTALAFDDGTVRVVDLVSGTSRSLEGDAGSGPWVDQPEYAREAALSGDGRRVALYDVHSNQTGVFDARTGATIGRPSSVGGVTSALALDTHGRRLAIGLDDGRVVVIDVRTGAARWLSVTRAAEVHSMVWGDDLLLAIDVDGTARLWDTLHREMLGDVVPVGSLAAAFSDDSLLVATRTGTVMVDLDRDRWAREACIAAGRVLTREEWAHYLPGRRYTPSC